MQKIQVGLVCSPGGHLTKIKLLKKAYQDVPHFFLTAQTPITQELPNAFFLPQHDSDRNILEHSVWFFQCLLRSFKIIRKQRPTLLISIGGGEVAIPAFFIGKLLRVKLLYIENRFDQPSQTGKILYWLSDWFFVQTQELLAAYGKKAEYHGAVI